MFTKLDAIIDKALHWAHVRWSAGPRCHYPLEGCANCEVWFEYDEAWNDSFDGMKLPDHDAYHKP